MQNNNNDTMTPQQRYAMNHKEELKEYQKQYRKNNPEKFKKSQRKYQKKHREKIWKATKEYRQKHPEWWKEQQKKYRAKHPDSIKQQRQNYKNNPNYKINYTKRNKIRGRRRSYRRCRINNIEAFVGYNCLICNVFTAKRMHGRFCNDCRELWARVVPRRVIEITSKSSFVTDSELIKWIRIMELRKTTYSARDMKKEK